MGEPVVSVAGPVQQAPKLGTAFRHINTVQPLAPPGLRVVSYNILADAYVGTDYAQQVLFSYCPPKSVSIPLRHLRGICSLIFIIDADMTSHLVANACKVGRLQKLPYNIAIVVHSLKLIEVGVLNRSRHHLCKELEPRVPLHKVIQFVSSC